MIVFKSRYADIPKSHQSVTERVFDNLKERLTETVLIDSTNGASLTAAEFIAQVKRLAGGLTKNGFGAGKTVAIMAPNSPSYCVIFHAVGWAGGTITTLNPTYTAHEVQHQLKDAGADLLITVSAFLDTATAGIDGLDIDIRVIESANDVSSLNVPSLDELFGEPLETQVPVDLESHTVVLPYSSGTTGLPKGVRLSHQNLVMNIDQSAIGADFRAGESAAAFLPFFHIYGMNVIMNMHLACGGLLITMPRFDLEAFLQICQDHRARRMWIVPPVALALAKHPLIDDFDLSSVDQVFSGAAPMGAELSDAVSKRLNCELLQGFGMTELAPVSHTTPLTSPRSGSSGLALPNTQCRIVDPETGKDLPAGTKGEMWIKGPQVMLGYHNNDDATKITLTDDGWLKTGDVAVIDEDGYMFIVDRLKELIKYKGFQVAPAELEATLVAHPGVVDAAVIGRQDEEAGEVPIAFIVASDDTVTEAMIKAHMTETLAHYKQIHEIHFVEEIPKSPSGKILRRLLRERITANI